MMGEQQVRQILSRKWDLKMETHSMVEVQTAAGWLLIISGPIFVTGGVMYTGRAIFKWPRGQTARYLTGERGFVMAAVLAAAAGLLDPIKPELYIAPPKSAELPEKLTFSRFGLLVPNKKPDLWIAPP
jgi:hypothetical protein